MSKSTRKLNYDVAGTRSNVRPLELDESTRCSHIFIEHVHQRYKVLVHIDFDVEYIADFQS